MERERVCLSVISLKPKGIPVYYHLPFSCVASLKPLPLTHLQPNDTVTLRHLPGNLVTTRAIPSQRLRGSYPAKF